MYRTARRRIAPVTIGLPVVLSLAACAAEEVGDNGATGGYAGNALGGTMSTSGTGGISGAGGAPTGGSAGTSAAGGTTTGGTGATTAAGGMNTGGSAGSVAAGGTAGSVSAGGTAGNVSAGGSAGNVMVDCSGIANAGYDLCSETADGCGAVFTDGAGCTAVCAAAGLTCVSASENLDDSCGPDTSRPEVACDSGHTSDFCQCGGPVIGTGGASGAAGTAGSSGTAGIGGTAGTSGASGSSGTAGTAGTAGTSGASGTGGSSGAGGTAGSSGTGGTSGSGGTSGNGGSGGSGTTGPCQAIGWATRNGRSGGAVNVTGGGNATPVVATSFSQLQSYASDGQARVIHVDGTVGAGWSGTDGDRLEVGSNKTIVGLRPGTQLRAAVHVDGSSNVIIRNLVIRGPGSNDDQAWDNLNIEGGSKNVWIDHCEFWDGQDGNADVVKGADNVTFTFNIFGYRTGGAHNFSNLVASSDDEPESAGKLNITFMFNWFTGIAQRQPRCRYGDIHVVNNLFSRDGQQSDYGISAGKDCRIVTEANHFIDINEPIYDAHASGSAANELRGGNIFENTSGSTTGYGTAFQPPYDYDHVLVAASQVEALVTQKVGAKLQSPTQCDW